MVHILYSEVKAVLLLVLRRVVKADEVDGRIRCERRKEDDAKSLRCGSKVFSEKVPA